MAISLNNHGYVRIKCHHQGTNPIKLSLKYEGKQIEF